MKQKKNLFDVDFVSVNAVDILVAKKVENNFSLTKWSHLVFFSESSYGAGYRKSARKFVDMLSKKYPDMYFMEKSVTLFNVR